jgi:hypothetical protein
MLIRYLYFGKSGFNSRLSDFCFLYEDLFPLSFVLFASEKI